MKKHLLVVSQYFYPESFRINDLCTEWVKRGYNVTVITGIPNYPEGEFYRGYGINKKKREYWNGIEIIRIPLIPRGKKSLQLLLNYMSFVVSGIFFVVCSKIKPDYVFTFEVSPLTQALIGVWYAKKQKIPHYLYVQDLWPENIEIVAGIHNSIILKAIQKMADYIYKNSTHIFGTSPSFVKRIQDRVQVKNKVHYLPQYAEDFYQPVESKYEHIQKIEATKIVFTGNIGYAQGLEILPKAAAILKNENCNIQFYIVGDGRYKDTLINEISEYNVADMFVLIDRQPAEQIPHFLAACDIAYLSFMKNELFSMTIPAKLQSYMACEKPIIAAASGETARIISDAKCGIVVPEGDSLALANAIMEFVKLPIKCVEEYGKNAREYYLKYFDKKKLLDNIDEYFNI